MLKIFALLFGVAAIAVGIMGFLPDFIKDGKLFGLFLIDPMRNVFHIALGVVALLCGLSSGLASRIFFLLVGISYAALAVLGFIQGEGKIYNLIDVNNAGNIAHAAFAIVSLYIAYAFKSK